MTAEKILDMIGAIFWFGMFVTPLITIPLVWKFSKLSKVIRVLMGLLLALFISFFLYFVSMEIIFRHGMGPA